MEGGAVGHNFEMGLPKDYPCQVWFNLVQRFKRKRFKCDLLSKYHFKIVSDSSALHSKWLLLLKIEISALLQIKMNSNFNCSYMAMSRLTYILGFSVKFFFQPIYTDYTNYIF
jgi:hypothetical protein